MTACSNCGLEIESVITIRVVGEDGAQHEISVCNACIDTCTTNAPGDWFVLETSGKSVRWKFWPCENCDGVYDAMTMKNVVDSDEERKMWVCPTCAIELQGGWTDYGNLT